MKANEFMIGDWVHCLLHDVDTTITDTEGPSDGVGDHRSYWLADMECFERHFPHEIDPIPINHGILEANGFEERHDYFPDVYFLLKESCDSDYYSVYLVKEYDTERREEYWNCIVGKYNADVTIAIHYVHELQHILRLCGINKEIVIK
jgi:hypothetical protein